MKGCPSCTQLTIPSAVKTRVVEAVAGHRALHANRFTKS
jgi:hypothetical protein